MLLSSSAYAGNSFSFVVGRHRVHIEAPRHCLSRSCVLVSIPGIYEARRNHEQYDDIDAAPAAAVPEKPLAPAPEPVSLRPNVPAADKPSIEPVASVPRPRVELAAATTREVAAPPPSPVQPSRMQAVTPMPPPIQVRTDAARPAPATAARISRIVPRWTRQRRKRRSATGGPKATKDRFASYDAAARCAGISSIHRQTTMARWC